LQSRPESSPPGKPRIYYGWLIVGSAWLMFFLSSAVAVSIFFKPILETFNLSRAALSGIYTLALLFYAAATPFLGRLIDRFGPRFMLFICLGTQTLSSFINGMSANLWHIFFARCMLEIKGLQSSQVLINRWFVKKRGQAQAIAATGMTIGAMVLSPLSQYLVLAWGWRETMFFWAGVTFIVLLPLTLLVRNTPGDKGFLPDGEPVSVPIKVEPPAISDHGHPSSGITRVSGHSLSGAIKLVSFWLLAATQLICGIGCGFVMTHIVIFATDMGYSAMIGASLLSVEGGLNLVGVLVTGHISDRHARNRVLAVTHVVRSLSFFTVVVFIVGGGASLWILYLAMALFGLGWFTTSPLTSGLAADLFGNRSMGTIIGVMLSCHTVGTALGAYAGGVTYEFTGSYYWFFIIQAVLELLAAGCAYLIKIGHSPIA